MRGMTSMRWVGVVALMGFVGACRCPNTAPEDCGTIDVNFESPMNGDTVASTLDVSINATRDGGAIDLVSATVQTQPVSGGTFSQARPGEVSTNRATFTGVTLGAGQNLIKVNVQTVGVGAATECPGSRTITVLVDNTMPGTPDVTSFTFQGDANADKVLNLTELPNPPVTALIAATGTTSSCTVAVRDQASPMTVRGTGTFGANGIATVVLDDDMAMNNLDATYALQAVVTCGTVTNNIATDVEAKSALRIDRQAPTCSLDAPMKTALGPSDDPDMATAGFQLRATASATGALTIEVRITGTQGDGGMVSLTTGPQTPMNGMISRDFTVAAAGSTTYTVAVDARDGAGNSCTASRQVQVDYDAPAITITSPTMAGSPYTSSYVIPVTANIPGGAGGTVQFSIGTRHITPPIAIPMNGMVATTANFANGANQVITAEAFDAARNRATATETFTVNVTGGCSIFFTRPETRPALITTANYIVTVQTSCPGPVTLKRTGLPDLMQPVSGGVASFNLMGLANGMYTFTAEVGSPAATDSIQVTVDTALPNIIQPVPSSGQTVAVLNKLSDPNPAAGAQTQLAFTATVPTGGRVDVCSNQAPAPGGAMPCPDGAMGWWLLRSGVTTPEPSFTFPEGAYELKLVIVNGGMAVAVSSTVAYRVDVTPPTTSMFRLLGDTNMDNRLNIAELMGAPPQVSVNFNTGTGPAAVTQVMVRDPAAAGTLYNNAAGVTQMAGSATVSLNTNISPTVSLYNFEVVVVDDVNNSSDPLVLNNITIDSVAPTCVISAPSANLFGGPMDADGTTAGYQLDQQVTTSTDPTTVAMSVSGAQTLTAMVMSSGGVATHRFTLTVPVGMVNRYSFAATCTDLAGNATVATGFNDVDVDLDPPTCTVTAPVASPPQYASFTIPTTITVGGAGTVGRAVTVFSTQGAGMPTAAGMLTVGAGGTASGNISYPFSGMQTVTAEVTDPAGNRCAATSSVVIDVNAMGCSLSIVSPVPNGPNGETFVSSTNISIGARTSTCGAGRAVTLSNITGGVPGTPIGAGGTTNGTGDVTLTGMLAAGGPYTLRATIDNGAGILTTADLSNFYVDTSAPTVTSVSPALMPPATTLYFVAAGNRNTVGTMPSSNYIVDTMAGAPANFTVQANGIMNAAGGRISVRFKGSEVAGQTIATDNANATVPVVLPHNDSGQLQVVITDLAGNSLTALDAPAVSDVVAPGAPTFTATLGDARNATVTLMLNSTPTYDDGADMASGDHDGFDIRWTTANVPNNNGLGAATDYFDSARAFAEANEPWQMGSIAKDLKLPPFNTYYVVVRAHDEVGNYSSYPSPQTVANEGTKVSLTNPSMTAGQNFGRLVVSSRNLQNPSADSLNGDAIDDLVVGASAATTNKVFVYFGRAGFTGLTTCPAMSCQEINLPGTASSDQFGAEISVGNVGDTASPDLIVGSPFFNQGGTAPNTGRVFIFFGGGATLDTAMFIELRGTGTQTLFGRSAQVIPDIDKDGIPELAVGAPAENSGRGRIYIYRGRSRALWLAARTALDGVVPYVPTSAATWVIEGPLPVTGVNNQFGLPRLGFTSLGDLDNDTFPDFTASAGSNAVNKVFLFSGNTVQSATMPITTGTGGTPEQTLATLSITPGAASTASFGQSVLGGTSFVGGMANDLLIAHGLASRVYVWADLITPVPSSTTTVIDGPSGSFFGNALAAGRIDGDTVTNPTPDVVVGENPPVGSASSNAWIFYSRSGAFDPVAGQFFQSKSSGAVSSAGAYGSSVAVGDFNNDSRPDIAIADPSTSPGSVVVWH